MIKEAFRTGRSPVIVALYVAVALVGAVIAYRVHQFEALYGWLAVIIVVAVYVWGVGNWSRVEPRECPLKVLEAAPAKSDGPRPSQTTGPVEEKK